ncbi:MAG: gliding motility-associated C-terminal domain-containing protein [Bacteroidota bacterium]|nr:gliding motility-associated C-terminal domain-containing protein [Bacteroidota bacterium]
MKKPIRKWIVLFFSFWLLVVSNQISAQCAGGGNLVANLSMLPTFQTVGVNAGDRYTFDGYDNITYIFSFCQGGGNNLIDTQIEICDQNGNVVYSYNDDHCGLGSEITWNCTANGIYSIVIYQYNCNASGVAAGDLAYRTVTPPNEQDCLGAIPLCFNTYSTTASYSGTGNYWNEIALSGGCPGNCMLSGEMNDVWYTFTVQTSGTVSFLISPNSSDDYDWAVYDLTSHDCMDIATITSSPDFMVSCNWYDGYSYGVYDTGPTGGSSFDCGDHDDGAYNDVLNVNAGETYVVNVSNYSGSNFGYTITFGGSASIVDNTGPYMENLVYNPICGSSTLTVQFSERLWCTSVEVEDFVLTGPEGTYDISDVWSEICIAGAGSTYGDTYYDDIFTLELDDYVEDDGDYTLTVLGGAVDDICANYSPENSLNFHINGIEATGSVITDIDCYGDNDGSATVNVTGGTPPYTYLWSNGETTQTAVNLPGSYSGVTVADSYGNCQDTVVVELSDPDAILVNAGPDVTLCAGGSVSLGGSPTASNGTAPYTYAWLPTTGLDDPAIANPTSNVTVTTTYILTVTDVSGCSNTDTVIVTMDPPIIIDFTTTDALCHGEASGEAICNVSGGTSPFTYAWSGGLGTNATAAGMLPNVEYTVTVTDDINCQETATVQVGDPPALAIDFDITDSECGFDDGAVTANVSGGTMPYAYAWDTGGNNASIVNLAPGDYIVTVTDDHACTIEATASVNHYGNNDVNIVQTQEILCYGESSAVLEAEMTDGTGPFTYNWVGSSSTSGVASNLGAGDYSVTITDQHGCPGLASYEVTQPPVLGVNLITEDVLCLGDDSGSAEVVVNGGVEPYVVAWSNGGSGYLQNNLAPGSYSVTITDANMCTTEASTVINEPSDQVHVYVTTEPVMCAGQSGGTATATAMGGTSPYQYIWFQSGEALFSGSIINSLVSGAYSVRVEDDNGCMDETSFSISEPAPLTIESAVQQASCLGYEDGQAAISVVGGTSPYRFNWSNGDTVAAIADLATGNYYLTITDANDCVEMLSVFVPENPRLCLRIPNAFTPNGDGVNDTWIVEYIDHYPRAHIMVFNRWGQKLYDARSTGEPWDGIFNGNKVPTGSYTYIIDLHNEIEPFTGVVSVVY